METIHDLESAFRRATTRRVITAAEVIEHLRSNGWTDLWAAYRACPGTGNWYSVRAALAGKPGHQKTLRAMLTLPANPRRA